LQQQIITEKEAIEKFNAQTDDIERKIKEVHVGYKEQVRLELGDYNEMKNQEI